MSWPASWARGPSAPYPLIETYTSLGLTVARASNPRPSRSITPGRKLSTSASAVFASSSSASGSSRRLSSTERLLRSVTHVKADEWPIFGSYPRIGSPPPGCSILITSAPRSASSAVANAPGSRRVRSRTRMPASGPEGGVTMDNLPIGW